jgi:predicted membrane-bound mannosyltransferase
VGAPRIARILAVVGTVVAIYLHILFGMNAGALWRDEVNSLEVATMRTFAEMWANLSFDSFPALFFVILRLFAGVPASVSDGSLRIFGAAIGLLILVAVWLNARWLRLGFPLITLALIGFNPMVIRYGDSIRAYGLGILFALLTIGAIWRLIESFTLRHAVIAVVIAVLSVQSLYYNAVLLFALCLAAATVTLRRRQIVQTLTVFAIGAVAAAGEMHEAAHGVVGRAVAQARDVPDADVGGGARFQPTEIGARERVGAACRGGMRSRPSAGGAETSVAPHQQRSRSIFIAPPCRPQRDQHGPQGRF